MIVVIDLFRADGQRHRQFRNEAISNPWRLHSHDGVGFAIHAQRLANNATVCAQPIPQLVAQDDFVIVSRYSFFRQEIAP